MPLMLTHGSIAFNGREQEEGQSSFLIRGHLHFDSFNARYVMRAKAICEYVEASDNWKENRDDHHSTKNAG